MITRIPVKQNAKLLKIVTTASFECLVAANLVIFLYLYEKYSRYEIQIDKSRGINQFYKLRILCICNTYCILTDWHGRTA